MYKIVNYDWHTSLPKIFKDFQTAFWIQQLKYPDYIIEKWENMKREIVWDPNWE